jgi:hypothetical protein
VEHNRIVVVDGLITISGIMGILNAAGVKASRRTVHYWIANNGYPVKQIGKVNLVPQRACADFIRDWHSRHTD